MNPGRFFVPSVGSAIRPMMGIKQLPFRGNFEWFGRITNSLKNFNWSNLLNGANKTLNVVNQTIPLVRQAGPMFNNMKSMLKLARTFGRETATSTVIPNINNSNNYKYDSYTNINSNVNISNKNQEENLKEDVSNSNYPNFFI